MRRLTWRNLLRSALLATGVSIGLGAVAGQPLLRSTVIAAEEVAAATVEEAAKVLDLNSLPLPEGAKNSYGQHVGSLNYEVDLDPKAAFEFHQKQLTKLGWKEVFGGVKQAEHASVRFQNKGFTLAITTYGGDPDKPKSARVAIINLGNVQMSKLPVVKGAKQVYASEVNASYSSALKTAEVVEATRKALTDAGWESYGSTSNPPDSEVLTFKKNAIRLSVFIGASPVQKGQVMISYNSTLLSADIPALANAKEIEFDDAQKKLNFKTSDSFDDVAKSYLQRLAKMGWTPTSKELSKTKYGDNRPLGELGFKNAAKDSLLLQLTEEDGATKVRMSLKTVADIAALEKELKAAKDKYAAEEKAKKEAAAAEVAATPAPKPPKVASDDDSFPDVDALIKGAVGDALKDAGLDGKKPAKGAAKKNAADKDAVSVPIPEGAKKVTQTSGNVLQIKWPANKGKASAEALRDQLLAAGWEVEDGDKIEKNSGNVTFTKDGKTLTLSFVDTGFTDVNMMLIGIGVKLSEGKADPDAKAPAASTKPKSKPETEPSDDDPIKALKKKLGRKPAKSDDGEDAPAAAPARPEKPKRGIAKLDKLPTEAKLVADGETIPLTNVIAYETVSGGRWVTRILATEKPIKQEAWIERIKKGNVEDNDIQAPYLKLELNDQDQPNSMSVSAKQTPGGTGSSGLKGEAIVEEGRARGSFKMTKPATFFDRSIIGEITFDVPVLTRDSQPAKQLANAKKLETSGKLLVNDKPIKLGSVVAYEVKVFDEIRTAIFFTEKPINLAKLKASLAKDGTDDSIFEVQSQVKVLIDKDDKLSMMNLWHDNASLNSNADLIGDVVVEDGRARGTAKLGKPTEFFGKTFSFDLIFDVEVLKLPAKDKE